MPTLSLYETPADPDHWHRVTAPGGYEWWHFDAEDAAAGLRVQIDLFDGDPFSGAYRRAYARYRRRPTRVAPPVPREYPALRLRAFENSRPLWEHHEPRSVLSAFEWAEGRSEATLGRHGLAWAGDGELGVRIVEMNITADERDDDRLSAELSFRPRLPRQTVSRQVDAADPPATHHRFMSERGYDVTGTVRTRRHGGQDEVTAVSGSGQVEHLVGTGPMDAQMMRTIRERHRVIPPAVSLLR